MSKLRKVSLGWNGYRVQYYATCANECVRFHVRENGDIRLNGRTITECPYCNTNKENDMKKVCIEVTPQSSGMIQEYLFTKGYTWSRKNDKIVRHTDGKYLVLDIDKKRIMWNSIPDGVECNLNALCDLVGEPQIKIAGHVVKFHVDYIKIGCERINLKDIEALNKVLVEKKLIECPCVL